MRTLREAKIGDIVRVVKLHGEGAVKRRIMDMGLTKGVEVKIRKVAPLGEGGCGNDRSGKRMRNFATARSGQAGLFHRLARKFRPCA